MTIISGKIESFSIFEMLNIEIVPLIWIQMLISHMVIETNYPQQQAKLLYVVNECNEKWSWECTPSNGTKGRNRF